MMRHRDNFANEGYSFKTHKYTKDELIEIMDYSNMVQTDVVDIIRFQDIDEDFFKMYIDKFIKYLDLYALYYKLSNDMIKYLYDNNYYNKYIATVQFFDEDMIDYIIGDDIENKVDQITDILVSQTLTRDRILQYFDVVDPALLIKYQEISEEFMEELALISDEDKKHILYSVGARYQNWSDDYIIEHKDYVDWFKYYIYPERVLIPYNKMDYFIPDDPNGYHPDDIEWPILTDPEDLRPLVVNNKNITPEQWKILITSQFPVYFYEDDFFVGFMAVTMDNYPLINYKHTFDDGAVLSMHADITNTIDSFGFNVISLNETLHQVHDFVVGDRINDKKVKLIKIRFEDVVHAYKTAEGYCVRAKKIEVYRDYREN